MDVRINQRWYTALEVPVQGQSLMEIAQSLVQSLVHTKMWTLVAPQVRKWSFFSTKPYRDHIESYLSELSYSESVQKQLEKMTFSLVDPLLVPMCPAVVAPNYFGATAGAVAPMSSATAMSLRCKVVVSNRFGEHFFWLLLEFQPMSLARDLPM
jgi:hypothetical protein